MRYLAVLVAVLGSLVPCQAQNLLPNPEFDQDVSGWTPPVFYTNALVWDSHHSVAGPGGSGLLAMSFGVNGPLSTTACVPVTPNVAYIFGGRYLFPAGISQTSIGLSVVFTSDSGCTNALTGVAPGMMYPNPAGAEQWYFFGETSAVAPANAQAALFSVTSESNLEPTAVYFDDLYFGRAGTVHPLVALTDVPALSPFGLLALALGLGGAAVWVLRRRRVAASA